MGAAMIAAVGLGWFENFSDCANQFIKIKTVYHPIAANVDRYSEYYQVYHQVYAQTQPLTNQLLDLEAK